MKVAIFGLGYVGTVTAACLATHGHEVWGVEIDPGKVALVDAGRSPIVEPGLDDLVGAAVRAGALHATGDTAAALDGADVSLICVATPSSAQAGTDLSHLDAVTASLAAALRAGDADPGRRHVVAVR
ncbi:GDP-mannose dehydrogenase, partial [Acidimicrobiaceae bacterium USS-CC1]|nr:GDP-mannose dehydrogenase [Acidiferrimicrobium australe]